MTKLITPMPLSPHAKTVGVTAIDATEIVVDNIEYFVTPADGEEGYALLCAVRDFKSNNPADYEGVIYTGRDVGNSKLTGVSREEVGTAREWPAGTSIACFAGSPHFARINAAIKSLQTYTTTGGLKNKLINGDFGVWQRGTSFTAEGFTADRWYFASDTDDTITVSRQSFSVGQLLGAVTPKYYLRVSVTAGSTGALNRLQQLVENVRTLASQDATLSFYARASKSITVSAQIKQDFGTGGSPSAAVYTAAEGLFITTDWAHYEATFAVPSVSGKTLGTDGNDGMGVVLNLPYNDTYTFDICLAQLEAGEAATPFEQRPADLESLLCGIADNSRVAGAIPYAETLGTHPFISTANKTYYIDEVSGSDSNNGTSAGTAFKTWAKAESMLPLNVYHNYTFNIVGNYTGNINVDGRMIGGYIRINGSTETPSNHVITGMLQIRGNAVRGIDGIIIRYLQPTGQIQIYGSTGVYLYNVNPRYTGEAVLVQNSFALIRECDFGTDVVEKAIGSNYGAQTISENNTGNATQFGLYARTGAVIAKSGTQPTGTSANEYTSSGGEIR